MQSVVEVFGLSESDFAFRTDEELKELKTRVRKGLRGLAKSCHPDVTDCPEKTELFRSAVRFAEDIGRIQNVPEPVKRRRRRRYSVKVATR